MKVLSEQTAAAAVTFVTAVHAHHASVRTDVALHALHSCLAGAQARHLLAVVAHRARRVAVARCKVERHKRERKREFQFSKLKATIGNKERSTSWFKRRVRLASPCLTEERLAVVGSTSRGGGVEGVSEGGAAAEDDNENVIETQEKQPRGRTSTPSCSWNH